MKTSFLKSIAAIGACFAFTASPLVMAQSTATKKEEDSRKGAVIIPGAKTATKSSDSGITAGTVAAVAATVAVAAAVAGSSSSSSGTTATTAQ